MVTCSHTPEQQSLPYRQNVPLPPQFGPPPPPPPMHWLVEPQTPKQHSLGSGMPGAPHDAPGRPHAGGPPSGTGCDAQAVFPRPSEMQLFEQHELSSMQLDPSSRHSGFGDPKHAPF